MQGFVQDIEAPSDKRENFEKGYVGIRTTSRGQLSWSISVPAGRTFEEMMQTISVAQAVAGEMDTRFGRPSVG
jgi:hypothetical protein